jgi:hypothetical protein
LIEWLIGHWFWGTVGGGILAAGRFVISCLTAKASLLVCESEKNYMKRALKEITEAAKSLPIPSPDSGTGLSATPPTIPK